MNGGVEVVRLAERADFEAIWGVYMEAREFMRQTGNPSQWGDFYPTVSMLEQDIERKELYVVDREEGICGVFLLANGPDPWYAEIDDGEWQSDAPYYVIHRVAAKSAAKGIFAECLAFALSKDQHLRIDTHEDNKVMQHILEKNGFVRCGIVYVHERRSPRIAYERTK